MDKFRTVKSVFGTIKMPEKIFPIWWNTLLNIINFVSPRYLCPSVLLLSCVAYSYFKKYQDISQFMYKSSKNRNQKKDFSPTFKPRPGTRSQGDDYEDLMVALSSLTLSSATNYKRFYISSNNVAYQHFDDIVLETESSAGEKTITAMQLKHTQASNRQVTLDQFTGDKGDFSLKTYAKPNSAEEACDRLILFTNRSFNLTGKISLKFERKDKTVFLMEIQIDEVAADEIVNTGGKCWEFRPVTEATDPEDGEIVAHYKKFLAKFCLYSNQKNVTGVEGLVRDKFKEMFDRAGDDATNFINFVRDWNSSEQRKKNKLTTEVLGNVLTLLLLKEHVLPMASTAGSGPKTKLLRDAISKFKVAIFRKANDNISRLWGDLEPPQQERNVILRTYFLKEDDWTRSKVLWLLKKSPLVVRTCSVVWTMIETFDVKNLTIIVEDNSIFSKNSTVITNLADLRDEKDIYGGILDNFELSLQGRVPVKLKFLLQIDKDFDKIVTLDELVQMTDDRTFTVGGAKEVLPPAHINRSISSFVVDKRVLEVCDDRTLVVIGCLNNCLAFKTYLSLFSPVTVEEHLMLGAKSAIHVYVTDTKCPTKDLARVIRRNHMETYHYFEVTPDGSLECVKTKGNVGCLKTFRIESYTGELDIYKEDFGDSVNVICGDAGVGKSTISKNLKNHLSPKYWAVILSATDVSTFLRSCDKPTSRDCQTFVKTRCDRFEQDVFKMFVRNRSVLFIWDGLDELSQDSYDQILPVIAQLSEEEFPQWISSRNRLGHSLEEKFSVCSKTVQQFSDREQDEYIRTRLKEKYPGDVTQIVLKIKEAVKRLQYEGILDTPLYVFMLTEIFYQDSEKYLKLLDNTFTIVHLYEYFVTEKFNISFMEKAEMLKINDFLKTFSQHYKQSYIDKCEVLALRAFFDGDSLRKVAPNTDGDSLMEEIRRNDLHGLIKNVTEDGLATFVHGSFGEYFAATYFCKNTEKIVLLKDVIFEPRYNNIRYMFDLLMAKDHPVHLAVLHKNWAAFEQFQDFNVKDRGGRTPLHVACSWGTPFPVVKRWTETEFPDIGERPEDPDYKRIVTSLLKTTSFEQEDDLFKMSALAYANLSLSMYPLALISQGIKLPELRNLRTVLYYAIKMDESHVLGAFDEIPLLTTEADGNTLLHLCVKYSKENCLKTLLQDRRHKETISIRNKADDTPLHIACENGNESIFRLLVSSGATVTDDLLISASASGQEDMIKLLLDDYKLDINAEDAHGNTPLLEACKNGNESLVKLMLNYNADATMVNKYGQTVMHNAAMGGQANIMEMFMANQNTTGLLDIFDVHHNTPLHFACLNGSVSTVELLLETGADLNATDEGGRTPLHNASWCGHVPLAKILLDAGASIEATNDKGWTPLHNACRHGHVPLVEFLIEAGANIAAGNQHRRTPLHNACQNGNVSVVKILLEAGAQINAADDTGRTPLYYASEAEQVSVVEELIKAGADVDAADDHGRTPLYRTCSFGYASVCEHLIAANASVDAANEKGSTPLHHASLNGYTSMVGALLAAGANVRTTNEEGRTPLHDACLKAHVAIVEALLEAGADIEAKDQYGRTPLNEACLPGFVLQFKSLEMKISHTYLHLDVRIVEILLAAGARVDAADKNGETPLYNACRYGKAEMVECLIKAGASVDATDTEGQTAFHSACANGSVSVVEVLLQAGASINGTDKEGRTPLHWATLSGHHEVVKALVESGASVNSEWQNETPLDLANKEGQKNCADILIKFGGRAKKYKRMRK